MSEEIQIADPAVADTTHQSIEPKKQKLWETLNNSGYYTKSYEDFDKQFNTPEQINKLHGVLNGAGYYTKSISDFTNQFFTPQKKNPISNASEPTSINLPTGGSIGLNSLTNSPDSPQYLPITDTKTLSDNIIRNAQSIGQQNQASLQTNPLAQSDQKRGFLDQAEQALYLPALNKGFNDLVVKPYTGAVDFTNRTINKISNAIVGQDAPEWLTGDGKNDDLLHNTVKYYDDAYNKRDKPTNLLSETAEEVVGTLPLMASLATGGGEASMATKTPQLISKLTGLLVTTKALSAYKDATDENKGYGGSLKEAGKGAIEGGKEGLALEAQMMVGGALGKGVANKLAEKGLLKGRKAAEAVLHALGVGTVFGGTSAGDDLIQGKDIDIHGAMKQFGMGLAFELPGIAKGVTSQIGDAIDMKSLNKKALQAAAVSTAASNLHSESVLRTLSNIPKEQLLAINDNIKDGHEDLYANSIELGAKAYDAKTPDEKRQFYTDQLALKTQGDVKYMADKLSDPEVSKDIVEQIEDSDEIPDEQKADLIDKVQSLSQKPATNEQPNPTTPTEVPLSETPPQTNTGNIPDMVPQSNEVTNEEPTSTAEATTPLLSKEPSVPEQADKMPDGKNVVSINEVLDKPVTYNGEPATLTKDGQTIVAKIDGGKREYELGNADDIGEQSIKDYGVEHTNSVVDTNDAGDITVRGKRLVNNYSDPKMAINHDADGNVISVNLETPEGKKRTFKGDIAEDIAYQIHLKELNKDNETRQQFEQFVEKDEPSKSAVVARENEVAAEKSADKNDEPVSRKPAVKKPKVISESKPKAEEVKPIIEKEKVSAEKPLEPTKKKEPSITNEDFEPQKETKAGDPIRAFADKVRQGKISKLGGFKAGTGFDTVWDGSLEVFAKTLDGTAKLADAIEAGLKHIKATDWYKNLDKKDDFDKQYRNHMEGEYSEHEKTLPAKNEATQDRADKLGVDLKENKKPPRSEDVLEKEASARIKDGYDVSDLIDRIVNEKHAASDTEIAILNKYIDAKEAEIKGYNEQLASDGATIGKRAFTDLMAAKTRAELDFQDAAFASQKTGRATAQALAARRYRFNKENSLENMIAKKREANGNNKLTVEQLADVTKTFSELDKTQKELEARLKKVEDENTKLKASQNVNKTAPARNIRRSVTKADLATERNKIFDDIRKEFADIRKSGHATSDIPYRREFAAIAKHMPQLLRNLAQDGLVRIEDVVDNLYATLKEDLPDITKRDVTDLIAGNYNEARPTKRELQQDVESLKRQAKILNQIEDVESGKNTSRTVFKNKVERDKYADDLREQLKEVRKKIADDNKLPELSADEKNLASLKKRIQGSIDKLSERLVKGDFEKEQPKEAIKKDAEAMSLQIKYDKIKRDFDLGVAKDALAQRTKIEKLKDNLLNIASLPRALKASLDFSAVLRQGLFLAPHLKESGTALKEMFGQTFSQEKYDNWLSDLKRSDMYDLMQESDLYISDRSDPKIIAREEEFTSNLADKIPLGVGAAVKASERAYTAYLNVLRAGVFTSEAQKLIEKGYTMENNQKEFKSLAKVINVLSGRGDIPEFLGGKQPKILSNALFSPRFMAARIQTLYLWADPRLSRNARVLAAKDIGGTLASGMALLSMAVLAGYKVNLDPISTNFLKIQKKDKHGTTYYDILGGVPQYVRLLSQIIARSKIPANDRGKIDLRKNYGVPKTMGRFIWGKLAPLPNVAMNLIMGEDEIGQSYSWKNIPMEFAPLPYSDVKEAYQVGGITNALEVLAPSQFGVSVSSYNPNAKRPKHHHAQ